MTIPSEDFTSYELPEGTFDESDIENGRSNSNPTQESSATTESEDDLPIPSPMVRRHRFPNYFPFLTLCRYLSIAYATDFITTEFASPAIRHTAVSYKTF